MKTDAQQSRYWVPMLGHAFRVLETFYDADLEMGLQQLTTQTGITKTSVYRILFTLESLGYLTRNADTGKYRLGHRILEAAGRARASRSVLQLAQPYMHKLHEEFGETVNLATLQNRQAVYVDTVEGSYAFRLAANVGAVAPLYATSLGKALLAFLPEAEQAALIPHIEFKKLTPRTITSRAELVKHLQKVRRQGYAVDNEEVEPQAFCIAAPIFDAAGRAPYALSVSGPTHRMRPRQKDVIEALLRATTALSAELTPSEPAKRIAKL